jgi:hypothetical protein
MFKKLEHKRGFAAPTGIQRDDTLQGVSAEHEYLAFRFMGNTSLSIRHLLKKETLSMMFTKYCLVTARMRKRLFLTSAAFMEKG